VRIVIPDDDCPAARSGLRNGDVLVAVEAETVSTIAEATQALLDSGVFSGDPVVLRVTRNGGEGESEIITLRLR
jgi:S1-C subfamily serine protease